MDLGGLQTELGGPTPQPPGNSHSVRGVVVPFVSVDPGAKVDAVVNEIGSEELIKVTGLHDPFTGVLNNPVAPVAAAGTPRFSSQMKTKRLLNDALRVKRIKLITSNTNLHAMYFVFKMETVSCLQYNMTVIEDSYRKRNFHGFLPNFLEYSAMNTFVDVFRISHARALITNRLSYD
jgi:hypothetical protein